MIGEATKPKQKVTIGEVESGFFKGRRIVVPEDHKQTWAFIEKGSMFGQPHFVRACLIHDEFIPDHGCDKCIAEKQG